MVTITSPAPNAEFRITDAAVFPQIDIVASASPAAPTYVFSWTINYTGRGRTFTKSGTAESTSTTWRVDLGEVLGGDLTVTVQPAGSRESASVIVKILGTNPSRSDVLAYIGTLADAVGFDRIVDHETHMTHFESTGLPKVAADMGFGIAQLTNPQPTYEQVWSWKRNIDAGVTLYQSKQRDAIRFLTQAGRTHTRDQLIRETVSRWNGGNYHEWSGTAWVRRTDVMCDPTTGNFGWNMNDPSNTGQTIDQLRDRDFPRNPRTNRRSHRLPRAGDHFGNFGVCYADSLLGTP